MKKKGKKLLTFVLLGVALIGLLAGAVYLGIKKGDTIIGWFETSTTADAGLALLP